MSNATTPLQRHLHKWFHQKIPLASGGIRISNDLYKKYRSATQYALAKGEMTRPPVLTLSFVLY